MAITIRQLTDRLNELPDDWEVRATKSGRSLEVRTPDFAWKEGQQFGYIFTDTDRPIRHQTVRGEGS